MTHVLHAGTLIRIEDIEDAARGHIVKPWDRLSPHVGGKVPFVLANKGEAYWKGFRLTFEKDKP